MSVMKTSNPETATDRNLAEICLASCQKLVAQIKDAKDRILAEFHELFGTYDQSIRLALNEAEALAWQTPYPQLFFPDFAAEKVQAVMARLSHDRSIRRTNPAHSLRA
jgi:hypothetical protein